MASKIDNIAAQAAELSAIELGILMQKVRDQYSIALVDSRKELASKVKQLVVALDKRLFLYVHAHTYEYIRTTICASTGHLIITSWILPKAPNARNTVIQHQVKELTADDLSLSYACGRSIEGIFELDVQENTVTLDGEYIELDPTFDEEWTDYLPYLTQLVRASVNRHTETVVPKLLQRISGKNK